MTSINSDFMSQLALRSLGNSSNMMTQAMERLSTGKRINSAADDAAAGIFKIFWFNLVIPCCL